MKRRLLAVMLAVSLSLTGCASLLDREYSIVSSHNAAPTAEGDPSILRAESYQELVNALLYFVINGAENGTIRLYTASDEVESNLEQACLEVVQEDPLGAYAVEFIKYSVNSVVTYSEAEVHITYRRSRDQIASITSATGVTAIRSELEAAMQSFLPECVLRISYFNEDEAVIRSLARQAYLRNPVSALDYPDVSVSVYPSFGRQRIVEVTLTYHEDVPSLEKKRSELEEQLHQLAGDLPLASVSNRFLHTARMITSLVEYDPEGPSSPHAALAERRANEEGLALLYAALCKTANLSCRVVEGTRNETPGFWNLVQTESGWRHIDLLDVPDEAAALLTDAECLELGYLWTTSLYPQSGPRPAT